MSDDDHHRLLLCKQCQSDVERIVERVLERLDDLPSEEEEGEEDTVEYLDEEEEAAEGLQELGSQRY